MAEMPPVIDIAPGPDVLSDTAIDAIARLLLDFAEAEETPHTPTASGAISRAECELADSGI